MGKSKMDQVDHLIENWHLALARKNISSSGILYLDWIKYLEASLGYWHGVTQTGHQYLGHVRLRFKNFNYTHLELLTQVLPGNWIYITDLSTLLYGSSFASYVNYLSWKQLMQEATESMRRTSGTLPLDKKTARFWLNLWEIILFVFFSNSQMINKVASSALETVFPNKYLESQSAVHSLRRVLQWHW